MKRILLLTVLAGLLATSCDDEFNPNGDWEETMIVYGMLDQDDDTTWVRVQKCYLSDGDMSAIPQIADSSNYPEGELEVKLTEWNARKVGTTDKLEKTTETGKVFNFTYKELESKNDGEFYSDRQPVYFCRTKGQLRTDKIYELRITNTRTGKTAYSETSLLGDISSTGMMPISINNNSSTFNFSNGRCSLNWASGERARIYQPIVRFFYQNTGSDSIMHVDVKQNIVYNNNGQLSLSYVITLNSYASEIAKLVTDHTTPKIIGDSITLFMYMGNDDLRDYLSATKEPSTLVQERPHYTNIKGGLGIFASRRTKISQNMMVPANQNSPYRKAIKNLNIGF